MIAFFVAMRNQSLNLQPGNDLTRKINWAVAQAPTSLSDDKLGVGWSRGAMDASVGYVQRQIHVINGPAGFSNGKSESVAALSFTFRPH